MRISDWSSDVCSSDLRRESLYDSVGLHGVGEDARSGDAPAKSDHAQQLIANAEDEPAETTGQHQQHEENPDTARECLRSEERRVGKECVSPGRSRWSPSH